jgi:glycosyltransferase involved in cell wall biosynthesis
MPELPTVTVNIAVYNEERRIHTLLSSLAAQDYPQDLVELLVVDGGSTDRTREICQANGTVIIDNPAQDAATGRRIGCERASGDLHIYMDADMEWADATCLSRLVNPFLERDQLVGSFPRYAVDPRDPPFNRCLSRNTLQQDPMIRFMSVQVENTIVERKTAYSLCWFPRGRAPVLGVVLFRTSLLQGFLREWGPDWQWSDVDFVIECAERNLGPFAFVPNARLYHHSYLDPGTYLRKKKRDVRWSYLGTVGRRRASYIRWDNPRDVARVALWLVYANLLFPGLVVALGKALKYRDWAMLYEAFATTVGTDYVLWQFLADRRGRRLLRQALAAVVSGNSGDRA